MDRPTYSNKTGSTAMPGNLQRLQEIDRWVSLRNLRNLPHVPTSFMEEKAPEPPQARRPAPAAQTNNMQSSVYLGVLRRHEEAHQRLTGPVPAAAPNRQTQTAPSNMTTPVYTPQTMETQQKKQVYVPTMVQSSTPTPATPPVQMQSVKTEAAANDNATKDD